MIDPRQRVLETIQGRQLADESSPLLLMISGGSDSTALCYLLHELSSEGKLGPLALLHVNHLIRGEEAAQDARFVASLAERLGLRLFLREIDVPALAGKARENVEVVGRRERYAAARQALEEFCLLLSAPVSSARICTAHTQDDRVENFYMRSIVGTGPGGFRSLLYRNGPIIRPVLDLSREALRSCLQDRALSEDEDRPVVRDEAGQLWREDATNAHTDRFRAFVRHEIVPLAKSRNPQLLDTLCRTMNLIADEDDLLDERCEALRSSTVAWEDFDEDGVPDYEAGCVIRPSFGEIPRPLQRRIAYSVLSLILGSEARVENLAVEAVVHAFADGAPISGYTDNIQGNLALSANKYGLRIEPMDVYRARRKRPRR